MANVAATAMLSEDGRRAAAITVAISNCTCHPLADRKSMLEDETINTIADPRAAEYRAAIQRSDGAGTGNARLR